MYSEDKKMLAIGAIAIIVLSFGGYKLYKHMEAQDEAEWVSIHLRCTDYRKVANSHSDTILAMQACDKLIADKKDRITLSTGTVTKEGRR